MGYVDDNLADLQESYLFKGRAQEARKILEATRKGKKEPDLRRLLRNHQVSSIEDSETRVRDSFDFLIAFYSLMEIASIIRYVPDRFRQPFREEAFWNLTNEAVREYYEVHYPLLLPHLFRLRLAGQVSLSETKTAEFSHQLFVRFLGMVNVVRDDEEIETFQWFLDDGSLDNYNLSTTLDLLKNPERTIRALMKDPARRTIPERSVSGAQKFCTELDRQLQEMASVPRLQSAVWHYYAYWFDRISVKVGRGVDQVLDSCLSWRRKEQDAPDNDDVSRHERKKAGFWDSYDRDEPLNVTKRRLANFAVSTRRAPLTPDSRAIDEYVAGTRVAVKRLLSKEYAKALDGYGT